MASSPCPATMVHMRRQDLALELAVAAAALAATAVLAAVLLPGPPRPTTREDAAAVFAVMLAATAGAGAREVMQRLRDSADRMRHAAAEHEAAIGRAIEAERARIATELHDVVTHHVSMMVVQAGAAHAVLAAVPGGEPSGTADAIGALCAIEDSGRTAISELRTMLGLLSPAAVDGPGGRAGKGRAAWAPQPGLGDLDGLVARVSAAGLPVELSVTGTPRPLPPGADLTAYRVVQESLTNVIRHGGQQTRTSVQLDWGANLVITVSDAGCVRDREPNVWKAGRGLLGLRERLALYGGELAAGPRPGGGWQVRAELAA
jgi:signal transduction histidine kinase